MRRSTRIIVLVAGGIIVIGIIGLVLGRGNVPSVLGGTTRIGYGVGSAETSARQISQRPIRFTAPLDGGYLFVDAATGGVEFTNSSGTRDVSDRFGLTTQAPPVDQPSGRNTVTGIYQAGEGRLMVATTSIIYLVRSIDDITPLSEAYDAFLYFSASAYDATTDSIFALPSHTKTVYRYDLKKPDQPPRVFYRGDKFINRITAGGGKLVVNFDSVPTTQPHVITAYARNNQLQPLVIDATDSSRVSRPLADGVVYTGLQLSGDGRHIASLTKQGNELTVTDLPAGRNFSLPRPNTVSGMTWQDATLYVAVNEAVWRYQPDRGVDSLERYANINAVISGLNITDERVLATTDSGAYDTAPGTLTIGAPANSIGRYLYAAPSY